MTSAEPTVFTVGKFSDTRPFSDDRDVKFCKTSTRADGHELWSLSAYWGGYDDSLVARTTPSGVLQQVTFHPAHRKSPIRIYERQYVRATSGMVRGEMTYTRANVIWCEAVAKSIYACFTSLCTEYPAPPTLEDENASMVQSFIASMNGEHLGTKVISSELTDSW
jgi:hypothetical protein